MKNPNALPAACCAALLTLCAAPSRAQDLAQDTLAVRILLDQNGLTAMPASRVIEIDPKAARVTALRLADLQLTSLPPQIGALTALKYLVLSGNLLDSLPSAVWGLASLVQLDLGGNRLGALDARVSGLKNLLLLGLRENGLASLPPALFDLPQLETLLLARNALDTLPEAVAELAFLRYLDLSGNQLRTVPFTVAAMDALDSLDLSSNLMTGLPDAIRGLPAAARVRLGSNRLCALGPELEAWADAEDPAWKATQACGNAVRPRSAHAAGPALRGFRAGGRVRVDWAKPAAAPGELVLRDVSGRERSRIAIAAGAMGAEADAGAGLLWAELREGGRVRATGAVPP